MTLGVHGAKIKTASPFLEVSKVSGTQVLFPWQSPVAVKDYMRQRLPQTFALRRGFGLTCDSRICQGHCAVNRFLTIRGF